MQQEIKRNTFPFSITREDYRNSSRTFDQNSCPFNIAFKRQFPEYFDILVGLSVVRVGDNRGTWGYLIATIAEEFDREEYDNLSKYGREFHTIITFEPGYEPKELAEDLIDISEITSILESKLELA